MTQRLAIEGGEPVRPTLLPYGRQTIEPEDEAAVLAALRSGWLTTGPAVERFEKAFAKYTGVAHAVAVSSGTAALHAAMAAIEVGPGDEVLVPSITFAASANAAVYMGARPVFVDVDHETLLIDVESAASRITEKTRAIVAVDYAGQPADYAPLRELADRSGMKVVADAAHSLGATERGRPVGSLADISTFSLHPVKHITAGEGGVVTTDGPDVAARLRRFRNHGISRDFRERAADSTWEYEIAEVGYNYRLSDLQCALAHAQLRRLDSWLEHRRRIASRYDRAFAEMDGIRPLGVRSDVEHAYHLYVIRVETDRLAANRRTLFRALRAENIGVNVHYVPVHLHPLYRERFGTAPGSCPVAESAYEEILTLPLFHGMTEADAGDVIAAVEKVTTAYRTRAETVH